MFYLTTHSTHFIYGYMREREMFYLTTHSTHFIYGYMREREMFYLTTHSTHFIYGYMASDIWLRTILIVRKETCCRHIGCSFRLTARVFHNIRASEDRIVSIPHSTYTCYTSCGEVTGMRNSSKTHYLIRQYNIQIFYTIIFFKYTSRQIKATETSNLLKITETH